MNKIEQIKKDLEIQGNALRIEENEADANPSKIKETESQKRVGLNIKRKHELKKMIEHMEDIEEVPIQYWRAPVV